MRVFDRYDIVSEAALRQAAIRQAEYVAHQAPAPTVVPLPGTSDPELGLGQNSEAYQGLPSVETIVRTGYTRLRRLPALRVTR